MKIKVLVMVQDIMKAQEHEWFVEYLNREKFEIHFLLVNGKDTFMDEFLQANNIPVYYLNYSGKKTLFSLFFSAYKIMRKNRYDIVHTHLFEASLAGLPAAFFAGVSQRIYTRHYSDYHHLWFPAALKYDKFINAMATKIIATSRNVQSILLKENVSNKKIFLIHHGIDLSDYRPGMVTNERIHAIKERYNLNVKGPIIGVISRFTEYKGLHYLIPAFASLLTDYPTAVLVMSNATGDYKKQIYQLLENINPENYRIIEFEIDVAALYKVFNCFVHIPINATSEAFGQTYLEALASKIPSVFTLSGVAPEFIKDKENALVVPFCDSKSVKEALNYILKNSIEMEAMCDRGFDSLKNFDIHIKINKLEQLYSDF